MGPTVYWLMQTIADVAPDDEWLAPGERETFALLRSPKRRRDWRLGRWTAKQAIAGLTADRADVHPLADFVVRVRLNGAPYCSVNDRAVPWQFSISHSHDRALCAVGPAGAAVGCDLERVEPRSDDFTREWFTRSEQEAIARVDVDERSEIVTLLWSAKESALKAIGAGLTMSTHSVTVTVDDRTGHADWSSLHVNGPDDRGPMRGWWRRAGADLITIVMTPALAPPVALGTFPEQD